MVRDGLQCRQDAWHMFQNSGLETWPFRTRAAVPTRARPHGARQAHRAPKPGGTHTRMPRGSGPAPRRPFSLGCTALWPRLWAKKRGGSSPKVRAGRRAPVPWRPRGPPAAGRAAAMPRRPPEAGFRVSCLGAKPPSGPPRFAHDDIPAKNAVSAGGLAPVPDSAGQPAKDPGGTD